MFFTFSKSKWSKDLFSIYPSSIFPLSIILTTSSQAHCSFSHQGVIHSLQLIFVFGLWRKLEYSETRRTCKRTCLHCKAFGLTTIPGSFFSSLLPPVPSLHARPINIWSQAICKIYCFNKPRNNDTLAFSQGPFEPRDTGSKPATLIYSDLVRLTVSIYFLMSKLMDILQKHIKTRCKYTSSLSTFQMLFFCLSPVRTSEWMNLSFSSLLHPHRSPCCSYSFAWCNTQSTSCYFFGQHTSIVLFPNWHWFVLLGNLVTTALRVLPIVSENESNQVAINNFSIRQRVYLQVFPIWLHDTRTKISIDHDEFICRTNMEQIC